MELGSVLDMSQALSSQKIAQEYQTLTLLKFKDQQKLEMSMAAKLLASIPSAQPDGVGGQIDCCA